MKRIIAIVLALAACGSSAPPDTPGHLVFAAVSAGKKSACSRTVSGAAFCWGANASGELGNGSTTDSPDV